MTCARIQTSKISNCNLTTFGIETLYSDFEKLVKSLSFASKIEISQVFRYKMNSIDFDLIIHFLLQIPFLIVQLIQATVSLKRLNDFLNADEIDKTAIGKEVDDKSNSIEAKNATFMWDASHHIPTLSNLSFSVKKGSCIGKFAINF